MKKTIYFIRHGQTAYNKLRIIQGSGIDSELNEKGQRQADLFYKKYKDIPFEVVLTSTLKRTHQTVKSFIDKGIPWEQFSEIVEMHWGILEGKKGTPEMAKDYERVVKSGNFDERIEGGESINEVAKRLTVFIEHLKTRSETNILVCVHGRVMRVLMCLLEGKEMTNMESYDHSNTGLYLVEYTNESFFLLKRNDTSHFD